MDSTAPEVQSQQLQETPPSSSQPKPKPQPQQQPVLDQAKVKATPAICKRRQAALVVQSPTDHLFSPCSQKLLHKKRTSPVEDF